jgi:hypothetical protein
MACNRAEPHGSDWAGGGGASRIGARPGSRYADLKRCHVCGKAGARAPSHAMCLASSIRIGAVPCQYFWLRSDPPRVRSSSWILVQNIGSRVTEDMVWLHLHRVDISIQLWLS